jgi:hypothetical protein
MPTPQEKKEELSVELQKVVEQHNQANEVLANCKKRVLALQGGIAALDSLLEEEAETEEEAED